MYVSSHVYRYVRTKPSHLEAQDLSESLESVGMGTFLNGRLRIAQSFFFGHSMTNLVLLPDKDREAIRHFTT